MSFWNRNRNRDNGPTNPPSEGVIPESRPANADGPTGDQDDPVNIASSEEQPLHVTTPEDQPIQAEVAVGGAQDAPPVQAEVAIGGAEGAPPVRVDLSGEVEVNINSRGSAGGPAGAALGASAASATETFEVRKQAESAMDGSPAINVPTVDQVTGNRMTVADVRQRYGDALDITNRHRAYSNGVLRNDTYQPETGEVLTWKEESKSRG